MNNDATKPPEERGPGLLPTRGQEGSQRPPLVTDPTTGEDEKQTEDGAPDPKRTEKKVKSRL